VLASARRAALTAALRRVFKAGTQALPPAQCISKKDTVMNDVSYTHSNVAIGRLQKPVTQRTFRASIQEAGACRLTEDEIQIVSKALLILENKVMRKLGPGEILSSPQRVKDWLTLHYGMLDREVFGLIFLDARHRYLAHQQLFNGDVHGASVHPRQVARSVFHYNASAVIALHCHPSMVGEPSQADELISRRLREVLESLDVKFLDHFVIAGNQVISMAEKGLI
jgi:DNA repair protein RadC